MRFYAPLIVMLACVAASGFVHGRMTDRWGMPDTVKNAAANLQRVPAVIGDWESVDLPISARELEIAEAVGHLSRRYTNRTTGMTVDILVLCGRPGPISVHEPTTCFIGAGFSLQSFEDNVALRAEGRSLGKCRVGDFAKQSPGVPVQMRTFWTWGADGQWQTPPNPRVTFAREPHLYKMYLTRPISDFEDEIEDDPLIDFMQVFLPHLNGALFQT